MEVTFEGSASPEETLLAELIRLEAELSGVSAVLDQIEEGLRRALPRPELVQSEADTEPQR